MSVNIYTFVIEHSYQFTHTHTHTNPLLICLIQMYLLQHQQHLFDTCICWVTSSNSDRRWMGNNNYSTITNCKDTVHVNYKIWLERNARVCVCWCFFLVSYLLYLENKATATQRKPKKRGEREKKTQNRSQNSIIINNLP